MIKLGKKFHHLFSFFHDMVNRPWTEPPPVYLFLNVFVLFSYQLIFINDASRVQPTSFQQAYEMLSKWLTLNNSKQ